MILFSIYTFVFYHCYSLSKIFPFFIWPAFKTQIAPPVPGKLFWGHVIEMENLPSDLL